MAVIGIDLGTTNSLAAIWRNGGVEIIPNALDEKLTPSVVSVSSKGELIVGRAAQNRLVSHPDVTVSQFKRLMGTNEKINLAGQSFLPEELSALILRQLKQDAEAWLGEEISEAIISVPAYFNDNQRRATIAAATIAGLHTERLINEPTAAAIAYGIHETEDEAQLVIVDLGGGTLDISILEKFDDLLEVHACSGDNFLGGEDFTRAVSTGLCHKYEITFVELSAQEKSLLIRQCNQAKEALSGTSHVQFELQLQNRLVAMTISREELINWTAPLMERFNTPLQRAIRDAKLKQDQVSDVILVGGASRMTTVKNHVGRIFGRIPSCTLDPDQVVVMGVSIVAALKHKQSDLQETVLTDVCPFSLGINTVQEFQSGIQSGFYNVIIQRNTVIPVSRVKTYSTIADKQTSMTFSIYQGENRLVKNNILLGKMAISVPSAPAGEETVDIRFTYNVNGILEVTAKVISTGQEKTMILQNSVNQLSETEIQQSLEKIAEYKIHPRENARNLAVLSEAECMYSEFLDERRNEIEHLIYQFEYAIEGQDPATIKSVREQVRQRLNEIKSDLVF
ncbi:Hsp70 family protein [Aliamphritea hakodatensis]|uniref:Hsp70 family protein n=1 Tax=Aliamphritea hakodatensis TaxID=2895352 RepID=UPI0022FDAD5B|nr:Hsp70 family protein [Aliamphritea hakodatensis]